MIRRNKRYQIPLDSLCNQTYERQHEALGTDNRHDEVEARLLASCAARLHTRYYQMPSRVEECASLPNYPGEASEFAPTSNPNTVKMIPDIVKAGYLHNIFVHKLQVQNQTLLSCWIFMKIIIFSDNMSENF